MNTYTVVFGQSVYDVCLQFTGSLNNLFQFMIDNGIEDINEDIVGKKIIVNEEYLKDNLFVTAE